MSFFQMRWGLKQLHKTRVSTSFDTHATVPQGRGMGAWADIDNC